MRKNTGYFILVSFLVMCMLSGCGRADMSGSTAAVEAASAADTEAVQSDVQLADLESERHEAEMVTETNIPADQQVQVTSLIQGEGTTLESRIAVPDGYERVMKEFGSFQGYLRRQTMKPDKSPVLLYDGKEKANQNAHVAVFSMPVFNSDLQQCADSVMRMYAEYFYSMGAYDQISFHLTNGFLMDYPAWKSGKRLTVNGNETAWVKKAGEDGSKETFLAYLRMVMSYAGTLSLDKECTPVKPEQIQAGDLFIKGGSPGHCVMVVDVAEDVFGGKCFLLAQGYMPAQDFQVLKNPLHENDPWYYEWELSDPVVTPEYSFQEGSLKRWKGFVY